METRLAVAIAVLCSASCYCSSVKGLQLARDMADNDPATRARAIESAVASPKESLALLLDWTKKTPKGVNRHRLYLSMFEVFGKARCEDGVPFLIKLISLEEWPSLKDVRTPASIAAAWPAVSALARIGQPAVAALVQLYDNGDDLRRLLAVASLALIDDPSAREALQRIEQNALRTIEIADQGLKRPQGKK